MKAFLKAILFIGALFGLVAFVVLRPEKKRHSKYHHD